MEKLEKKKLQDAIGEIKEVQDFKRFGPKHHAKCPDCGAIVYVRELENGRYELDFVEHKI